MEQLLGSEQTVVELNGPGIFGLPACEDPDEQPVWYYPVSVIAPPGRGDTDEAGVAAAATTAALGGPFEPDAAVVVLEGLAPSSRFRPPETVAGPQEIFTFMEIPYRNYLLGPPNIPGVGIARAGLAPLLEELLAAGTLDHPLGVCHDCCISYGVSSRTLYSVL
jgi:hypothetical protein